MNGSFPVLLAEINVVSDADPEEAEEGVFGLRNELLELDVERVDRATVQPAPAGAKGLEGTVGALVVTLSDSAVLVALAGVLRSWVSRDRSRKVTIRIGKDSIDLSGVSEQDQAKLVEAWLDRHAGG